VQNPAVLLQLYIAVSLDISKYMGVYTPEQVESHVYSSREGNCEPRQEVLPKRASVAKLGSTVNSLCHVVSIILNFN